MGYEAQSGGADVVEGKVLLANVSRANKRCNKNVVPRFDFGAAGSSLVFCRASILASGLGRAFGSLPNRWEVFQSVDLVGSGLFPVSVSA